MEFSCFSVLALTARTMPRFLINYCVNNFSSSNSCDDNIDRRNAFSNWMEMLNENIENLRASLVSSEYFYLFSIYTAVSDIITSNVKNNQSINQ